MSRPPSEPEYSCPYLDSAISELEKARSIHDRLRQWGHYWMEKCEELQKELDDAQEEFDKDRERLEDEIQSLKDEIKYLDTADA